MACVVLQVINLLNVSVILNEVFSHLENKLEALF